MPTSSRHRATALVAAVFVLLGASIAPASAADAPRPKAEARTEATFGGGKGAGPYLTRDQLRECFARQDKVRVDDAELVKEQAALKAEQDAIKEEGEDMKTRMEAVDRTQAESVAAYNERVETRNQRLRALQTRVDAFNDRVEAGQHLHAELGQICANRRYFDEDAAALKKGR